MAHRKAFHSLLMNNSHTSLSKYGIISRLRLINPTCIMVNALGGVGHKPEKQIIRSLYNVC